MSDKSLFKTVLMVLMAVAVAAVAFAPAEQVRRAYEKEVSYVASITGEQSALRQMDQAENMTRPLRWVCGTEDGVQDVRSVEAPLFNKDNVSDWMATRADACRATMDLLSYRLAGGVLWIPLLLPLFVGIAIDAFIERKIRGHRFSFPSPGLNHLARRASALLISSIVITTILPITIHPWVFPALYLMLIGAFWVWLINMQKKI